MNEKKRPPIRISFKYNKDTGEIEEFIVDDNAPTASETLHNKIAEAISSRLGRRPEIEDAGNIRLPSIEPRVLESPAVNEEKKQEQQPAEESGE
jgi:plasmid stabilization system protein ParE